MSAKSIITEIETDVSDVISTQFTYTNTAEVPNANDAGLSYERSKEKRGKNLETCVLYVDIRDSIALTEKHKSITMGKIYTAFTKAVIKAGREHGGHTRNIIGDRVMIVFPKAKCFTNAVECAVTINHIAKYVLNAKFSGVDFKCGIGIDYGELKIIKVGIQRNGTEGPENKGLVWAGYPANIASRLTDLANKTVTETYYTVLRNPINPRAIKSTYTPLYSFLGHQKPDTYDPKAPLYLTTTETVEMTESEFAQSFAMYTDPKMGHFTTGGKMISFERKERTITYPPILITEKVYKGLLTENPGASIGKAHFWTAQKQKIRNVDTKVYGSGMIWQFS
ncbi:adenylate/guanylate cyclase domain-containing protein [Mucilaginibacter psychrotolerans]|uniref:Adenylate/guanylate cyclase domain-containing protein n=1 Tax=Mucilaginibacter psychrotolerans TaxID=1524096 RepID=A0A4Y8SGD1_9SPHI|nr:adenylate/guanylate cyclase domain-containing protein [Mucilaginibacter psychrotolerans]TFF37705.1 adenylate/guanylate cyclase domain-containing protein [Mucilaginibacter psychrotolerans]